MFYIRNGFNENEMLAGGDCECDLTPTWFSVTISINHLLLTTNRSTIKHSGHNNLNNDYSSSINFLIYCSVGEKFKAVVKKIYLKKGKTRWKSYLSFVWQYDREDIKYHSISKKLSAVLWKQTSLKYSKICLFYWSRECQSAAAEYFQMSCSLLAWPW